MVSTRSKRRRDNESQQDNDNDTAPLLDIQLAETALQAAESARLRQAQEKKKRAFARNHPPLDRIPTELLTYIFLYLRDLQTICNLAKCAKFLRKAAMTPQVVVRAAVFTDGTPRAVMGQVVAQQIGTGSIHVPSVFRLVRIALAKRCERGAKCCGYNLVTQKPKKLNMDRPFGLALCESCAGSLCASASRSDKINRLAFLANKKSSNSLLTHPVSEQGSGESVGPWLLCYQVKQVLASYWDEDEAVQVLNDMHRDFEKTIDTAYKNELFAIHAKAEAEFPAFEQAKTLCERE